MKCFLPVLILVLGVCCAQAELSQVRVSAIDAAVESFMESEHAPGVALGIILDREIVYTKGYGWADIENRIPMSDAIVVNWASNCKPVMAVMALVLEEEGLLDLNQDIRVCVPEFPEQELGVITARHLLCHQSGIPHYERDQVKELPPVPELSFQTDPLNALPRYAGSVLKFNPGAEHHYSSYGYGLLSCVVQRAAKQPIAELLQEKLCVPLGLSSFQLDLPNVDKAKSDWAKAYRWRSRSDPSKAQANGGYVQVPDTPHFWKHGAGGYKSNVRDFVRFALALMNSELLSPAATQRMWTPQSTNDGTVTEMGLGVVVTRQNGQLKISHNGKQDETRTRMVLYPDQGHGMVVMSNCSTVDPGRISTLAYRELFRDN